MRNFQERKKYEHTFFSFSVMAIIFFFAVFALLGTVNAMRTKSSLNKEIDRLKSEIAKAEKTRQDYETQMKDIRTSEGIDREARSRFNLQKPGEEAILFVDDNNQISPVPEGQVAGAYHAVQRWLKNIFTW